MSLLSLGHTDSIYVGTYIGFHEKSTSFLPVGTTMVSNIYIYIYRAMEGSINNDIHIDTNTMKQHGSVTAHLEESSSGRHTHTPHTLYTHAHTHRKPQTQQVGMGAQKRHTQHTHVYTHTYTQNTHH